MCVNFGWRTFFMGGDYKSMWDLICFVVICLDGYIVGKTSAFMCNYILKDKPLHRLLKLLLVFGSGICYSLICIYIGYGDCDISLLFGGLIIFGPVILPIVLLIINYILYGKNE